MADQSKSAKGQGTQSSKGRAGATVHWPRVKETLDNAITAWVNQNGHQPDLIGKHGASFGWATKSALANASALGYRLIDPAKVGNGQGAQTNLVISLRDRNGVGGNGQMPDGGPYLSAPEIQEIIDWIDGGMID
jgi:hypothetical protein